jgi:hypothetical protein
VSVHPPSETAEVQSLPSPSVPGRSWKLAISTAALAVLFTAGGVVIGRATAPEAGRAEPFDLEAFAEAWGSGDADQIRPFYTDDAVIMPFGHILSTLTSRPMPEYWVVSGPDIDREAAEHVGGTLEFFDVEQIGDMVVATGQWTFPPGLFPNSEGTVIKTTDIWHRRNGKIWRQFTDFQVYVDGDLIDM